MNTSSVPTETRPPWQVPVVTVVMMATIVLLTLVPNFALMFTPPIFVARADESRFGILALVPPALGLVGAVTALFSRSIPIGQRLAWALASAVSGFVTIALSWRLLVLLLGP